MTALGVTLLVVGGIMVLIEAHVPRLGLLGGPGAIAVGAGALLAISGLGGGIAVAVVAAFALIAVCAGTLALSLRKGFAVRGRRVRTGPERLLGQIGVVRRWDEPSGKVLVDGALWTARRSLSPDDPVELHVGDSIVVERLDGLTLAVRPAEEWELVR